MEERRTNRSSEPLEALTLLLDAARKRLGVRALTVATTRGRLVAGSGEDLDRVAALGTAIDRGEDPPGEEPDSVATWRLRVGKQKLVISSLGKNLSNELGEGLRRILGPA